MMATTTTSTTIEPMTHVLAPEIVDGRRAGPADQEQRQSNVHRHGPAIFDVSRSLATTAGSRSPGSRSAMNADAPWASAKMTRPRPGRRRRTTGTRGSPPTSDLRADVSPTRIIGPKALHQVRSLRSPGRRHRQRFPRFSCSRSIASNSALKLPTPKPREPWRSMISKKNVGRSWTGRVKIWRR